MVANITILVPYLLPEGGLQQPVCLHLGVQVLLSHLAEEQRSREQGAGSREQGARGKKKGARSKEQGAGSKEQGARRKEQGARSKDYLWQDVREVAGEEPGLDADILGVELVNIEVMCGWQIRLGRLSDGVNGRIRLCSIGRCIVSEPGRGVCTWWPWWGEGRRRAWTGRPPSGGSAWGGSGLGQHVEVSHLRCPKLIPRGQG